MQTYTLPEISDAPTPRRRRRPTGGARRPAHRRRSRVAAAGDDHGGRAPGTQVLLLGVLLLALAALNLPRFLGHGPGPAPSPAERREAVEAFLEVQAEWLEGYRQATGAVPFALPALEPEGRELWRYERLADDRYRLILVDGDERIVLESPGERRRTP